jgi:hypothetical protein
VNSRQSAFPEQGREFIQKEDRRVRPVIPDLAINESQFADFVDTSTGSGKADRADNCRPALLRSL